MQKEDGCGENVDPHPDFGYALNASLIVPFTGWRICIAWGGLTTCWGRGDGIGCLDRGYAHDDLGRWLC
eukprot:scaffold66437_cov67-Cyclotella_meneghiniana.AAC.1